MNIADVLPDRSCGQCTLCCKILAIPEIAKPQGQWCPKCQIGKGCKVYESRPTLCAGFTCGYLFSGLTDERWFPASCKMVIVSELDGDRIAIHVDPSRPGAWREEPFYSTIKGWAIDGVAERLQVVISVSNRITVILPDDDVDLGQLAEGDQILSGYVMEGGQRRFRALKVNANDPRRPRQQGEHIVL